jgi:RNA polymerase sigma factor (sigma-70 family)
MEWLEPAEREMMLLRYLEGFEYHEIASMLNIPVGTVQWKIFHSKRKLAARFGAPA